MAEPVHTAKKMVGDQIKPLIGLWHELHVHLTVQPLASR